MTGLIIVLLVGWIVTGFMAGLSFQDNPWLAAGLFILSVVLGFYGLSMLS